MVFFALTSFKTLFSSTLASSPFISPHIWNELDPYLLPIDHPIKSDLDRLFGKSRVTESIENFQKAGFEKPKIRQPTNIVVGKHPEFKNYIFKVYLDTQPPLDEWLNWIQRIDGARAIQQCLNRHNFRHFTVPKKWIYPLPSEPPPSNATSLHVKKFILIAEKMKILSSKKNLKAFRNKITPLILQELYLILSEEGLIDSVYPDNIPFTKEGKIAFVDTEHHYPGREVPYDKLTSYLSIEMQEYWKSLTKSGN